MRARTARLSKAPPGIVHTRTDAHTGRRKQSDPQDILYARHNPRTPIKGAWARRPRPKASLHCTKLPTRTHVCGRGGHNEQMFSGFSVLCTCVCVGRRQRIPARRSSALQRADPLPTRHWAGLQHLLASDASRSGPLSRKWGFHKKRHDFFNGSCVKTAHH